MIGCWMSIRHLRGMMRMARVNCYFDGGSVIRLVCILEAG
ncbi:unnamed protein product [Rhodiola kirilowii]